ncbi:PLP-dependent transferase [Xylaria grammica]|nr:PLP-dependent transferase [Xylaria grammica]
MVKIPAFEVEQWMDTYENTPGVLNIAETCASSISVSQLGEFYSDGGDGLAPPIVDFARPMTYGAIRGSDELRRNIAALCVYSDERGADDADGLSSADIIVTQGAIAANHLVFYTLVGPGDHIVCIFPTYQQLYTIPETLGAEVSLWKLRTEDQYVPDVAELEKLIKNNTKMIVINNPNNPTGATTPKAVLARIIEVARKHDIIVFSDEVYRPLFHGLAEPEIPPSALSLGYEKVLVTSSMSKAWALAGIRVGWVASRDKGIIEQLAVARDYTTISVSQLDDQVARFALSAAVRPALLKRNIALASTNLALLEKFVQKHTDICSWVKPTAGTTALVRFSRKDGQPVDDEAFCRDVLDKTKVFFLPAGRCFGHGNAFQGYVRIGYVSETPVLRKALDNLSTYVAENLN